MALAAFILLQWKVNESRERRERREGDHNARVYLAPNLLVLPRLYCGIDVSIHDDAPPFIIRPESFRP